MVELAERKGRDGCDRDKSCSSCSSPSRSASDSTSFLSTDVVPPSAGEDLGISSPDNLGVKFISDTPLSDEPIKGDFPAPLAGDPIGVRSTFTTVGDGNGEQPASSGVGMGVVESDISALGLLEK